MSCRCPTASSAPVRSQWPLAAASCCRRPAAQSPEGWIGLLELQAASMLSAGQLDVMDVLGRQFESALIKHGAQAHARAQERCGRAAGIGRNTITRKIVELGIDGAREE